jgi:2-keto-4-pentenoate hydratase
VKYSALVGVVKGVGSLQEGYQVVTSDPHCRLAQRLREAYSKGAVPPLRDELEPTDIEGAYAVQAFNARFWVAQGRRIVGRKVGLTAKAIQQQFGVDQPDFGVLFEDMQVPDGGTLLPSRTIQPRVEAEIAFVLATDLPDPDTSSEMVEKAVSSVHTALEIVDSRIVDWDVRIADTIADNGSSAYFVLADDGKAFPGPDLWSAGMVMTINDEVVSVGAGAAVLGHPLNSAAWLARALAEQGESLKKGDVILTGSLGSMVSLKPGDRIRAVIGGVGECGFRYEEI